MEFKMAAPMNVLLLPVLRKGIGTCSVIWRIPSYGYAKKVGAAAGGKVGKAAVKKREFEVEDDPEKLCKFVCGANLMKEGTDPEIKPDSEYPDWLWTLLDKRESMKRFSEMTESEKDNLNTKDWQLLRRHALRRKNMLSSVKKK